MNGSRLIPGNMQPRQVGCADGGGAAGGDDAVDRLWLPKPRHAQEVPRGWARLTSSGKAGRGGARPQASLGSIVERQHAFGVVDDLAHVEPVETASASRPDKSRCSAHQRRGRAAAAARAGIGDRAERRIIHPLELVGAIEIGRWWKGWSGRWRHPRRRSSACSGPAGAKRGGFAFVGRLARFLVRFLGFIEPEPASPAPWCGRIARTSFSGGEFSQGSSPAASRY